HMTINAAVRLADVSVKARRTASQLALARKEREHLREVMAEEQRMMGLRGQQPRPRLRRRES
ncbi:MAG: hypothetical protein SFX73_39260, partial [Kofleriaceae bacterium]|nr:hypothetical protein [Kofleriaceae bacterium]MDX2093939.1 hypothetical protein [Kofleriaceae bacterium]